MQTLYIISVTFWIIVSMHSINVFWQLREQGLSRKEVTAITILLLAGLNISKGTLLINMGIPHLYSGELLLEYFYVGSSVFQILLCNIVLKYIKPNTRN